MLNINILKESLQSYYTCLVFGIKSNNEAILKIKIMMILKPVNKNLEFLWLIQQHYKTLLYVGISLKLSISSKKICQFNNFNYEQLIQIRIKMEGSTFYEVGAFNVHWLFFIKKYLLSP